MRISLLLQREPFAEILEKSLADFFRSRTGHDHQVTWKGKDHKHTGEQNWLCNPYLNAIFVPGVRKAVLEPVIREFSRSTRYWRIPLQRVYVELATARRTCRWFATAFVEIVPPLESAENCLILGGNHHLRLLDYRNGCCFVITKSGFSREIFAEELRIRRENTYLPSPSIRDVAVDGSWYSEELILGTPINRLKDPRQAEETVRAITPGLFRLYELTHRESDAGEYAADLVMRINSLLAVNNLLDAGKKAEIMRVISALHELAVFRSGRNRVDTVQSHGDFQPANILRGERQSWLIDWEYTARRQIHYDLLVFLLCTRSPSGMSERMAKLLSDRKPLGNISSQWLVPLRNKKSVAQVVPFYLLEDIELRIKEMSGRTIIKHDFDFYSLCSEIMKTINPLMKSLSKYV